MRPVDSTRAFKYHWQIWRLMGMHPADPQTLWGRHYTVYGILWNAFFRLAMALSLVVNFLLSTSLESFCESLCVAVPHTVGNVKGFFLWRMRQQILQTHAVLHYLDRRIASPAERQIILEGIERAYFIFIGFLRAFLFILGVALVFLCVSNGRPLLYPSWVPWDYKESSRTVYVMTAMLHSVGILENALLVCNVDTYPGSYLIMVAAQLQALAHRVSRLGYDPRLTHSQACDRLRGCIKDHQIIINLFKALEHSLSMSCFLQFASTAVAQCATCFFVIFVSIGTMQSVNMIFLFMVFTTQTLLLCYSAELVRHEGENLTKAIYDCNWLDQSVEFRRMLLLMLARSQRPMIMRAGLIIPVQMSTFMVVCKGAYTMLTLLREVDNSEVV